MNNQHPAILSTLRQILSTLERMEGTKEGAKAAEPVSDIMHTAQVRCGCCGRYTSIALGMASTIVCGWCKTEIVMGEEDHTNEMIDAFREIVAQAEQVVNEHSTDRRDIIEAIHDIAQRWAV